MASTQRRTRIKFCGLVRARDVDDAVALGVDAVGFVFYPRSPRAVGLDEAAALRRRLPSFVRAVGLFVDEAPARIAAIVNEAGLDVVQLHGDEPPALCAALRRPVWKALRIAAAAAPQPAGSPAVPPPPAAAARVLPGDDLAERIARYHGAEFCLLDADSAGYGGSGSRFDWARVPASVGPRIVLSGGLHAGSVGEAIVRVRPFAVDCSSGIQGDGPRLKDAARMAGFVAAVEAADRSIHEALRLA